MWAFEKRCSVRGGNSCPGNVLAAVLMVAHPVLGAATVGVSRATIYRVLADADADADA